jgi:hypothetical protein
MKKLTLFALGALALLSSTQFALALTPRLVFEKNLFAEGVDPQARYLDHLMVKFFDEDMVRVRDGQVISTNGRNSLGYTTDFLARHPEVRVEVIISEPEDQYEERQAKIEAESGKDLVDLFSFYRFRLPEAAKDPKALLADILKAPEVETAYYESIPVQSCGDLGSVTGNYEPEQGYHRPAPGGLDLDYAISQYTLGVTSGNTGTWAGIIEYQPGTDLGHEDFNGPDNGTTECGLYTGFHATAVMGVVGACDANNVGVTGFVSGEHMRGYDMTCLGSIANVYNRVNSQLFPGEVTSNSWGFFSNPMPPGQSCPCNPGQNGMVPAEYDPATKAAIAAGAAAGIMYFLSAGNGCTNLDAPVYGNTFRWATDTGSLYVGAVQSAPAHDAACFTDFGERVTLNAWGENVTTTGYGDRHSGSAGRNEYYTSGFNGTSSAGPIAAGAAGVVNNIYRNLNGGANIAPTTMRSWLAFGGTAPGVTPGNIGVMPNLRWITGPDLAPHYRAGFYGPIVPRNTADANGGSATLPGNLNSDPNATYWNWTVQNYALFAPAAPVNFGLYADDNYFVNCGYGSGGAGFTGWCENFQTNMRGGRHTIRNTSDEFGQVNESAEYDNDYVQQFVWDPQALTAGSVLQYSRPPTTFVTGQWPSYPDENCDGFSGINYQYSGWWDIMAVMANTTGSDYDAYVYSEPITSTNGFDTWEQRSYYGSGLVDYVGVNNNTLSQSAVLLAAVHNYSDGNDQYRVEGHSSTILSPSTPGIGRTNMGNYSIGATNIFDNFEFNVDQLVPYDIEVQMNSGSANIEIGVFGPDDSYFSRSASQNVTANANGAGGSEMISCWTPASTGWHGIVISKYDANDWDQTANFTLYVGKAAFDMTPNLDAGWSHKLVVTPSSGSLPFTLPATLPGNVTTNYLHLGLMNIGCATSPAGLNTGFFRDGPSAFTTGSMITWAPGVEGWVYNQGPIFVFGGRHNIGGVIDVNAEGAEWREDNNRDDEQFVWTPFGMTNQTPYLTGVTAPNWRNFDATTYFPAWNQDGWRFSGGYWSGVAMVPNNVADNYLCMLYNPTTGSTNGFDTQLVPSFNTAGGGLNFVVENGNVNGYGSTFDVGVTNNWGWPGTPSVGTYRTYQCNRIQDLANNALNGPFTLGLNQLIHVYDLYLVAGDTTRIILDNLGATDLGLAVYAAGVAYGSRTNNGTVMNSNGDGGDETIVYIPTVTGYHGVVVFKNDLTDLASTDYRLIIGDRIPSAPLGMVLKVVNNMTNPIQMLAHWDSVTTDVNGGAMNVDQYQLFYSLITNPAPFPTGWTAYLTTPLATINFSVAVSVVNFRMVVVAQDADGLILSHSPLPDGGDVTGIRLGTGSPTGRGGGTWVLGENPEGPPAHARE